MRGVLLALMVASLLAFAGCSSQAQPSSSPPPAQAQFPAQQPAAPAAAQAQMGNASAGAGAAAPPTTQPPASQGDACTVEFQKDASSVYYVMVKTASAKQVSVTCPNGKAGVRQGGLYFCSQLDTGSPAIAYLDGAECGRAQFSKPPATAAAGGQQCRVMLSPSRITAGKTSAVTVTAYVPVEKSRLTYNCGNRLINESAGGMVDSGKICTFSAPGTVEITASINGEECASALLEVFESARDCSVYGSGFRMDRGEYVYTALLAARGYSGTDEIRYRCYDVPFAIKASTIQNTTDFVTTVECRSASGPLGQNVKVYMNSDLCGELVAKK